MPTYDPGLPPWADFLLIALVVSIPLWLTIVNRRTSRKLDAVTAQVENDHADADYPNLRDEVTSLRLTAEATAAAVEALTAAVTETRQDLGGMRSEMRTERTERRDVSKRLDAHLDEVPSLTAAAITKGEGEHIAACPLRTSRSTP